MSNNPIRLFFLLFLVLCSVSSKSQQNFPEVIVQYDSAKSWTFGNLQLIPVRYVGDGGSKGYLPFDKVSSLQRAIRERKVKINELKGSGNADVRVLEMRNNSKQPIVLHSGDIITGGKQDRIISQTMILPPDRQRYYVNVYCVEKGRWDRRAKPFDFFRSADMGLRRANDLSRKQHKIWETIENQFTLSGRKSQTNAYKDILTEKRFLAEDSQYVKFFTDKLSKTDSNFAGFLAITGDQIIGTDLYSTREMTMEAFQNSLRSYAATAIVVGDPPTLKREVAEQFMTPILSDNKTRNEFLKNRGRVYMYQGKIIHIVAYGD
ncbi:MAG TPA: DUF6569 family protein [Chitinophagaceae bacterium]